MKRYPFRKLGKAFPDTVISEKRQVSRGLSGINRAWWLGVGRVLLFTILLCICFFILFVRLFHLTVIRGHEYRTLADGNRIRELIRHAPRGIIRDRTGAAIVTNDAQFRLLKPCADRISGTTGPCVTYLSRQEGERISKAGLPTGTFLEADYRRRYELGQDAAHILGYTGEISAVELDEEYYRLRNYRRGDRIGREGIEVVFEDRLRGRDGKELVEVDAQGRILRVLGRDPEVPGMDINLSIDSGVQQAVAGAFPKGTKGAVVVSKPATGEILALYSSPNYDPNIFSAEISQETYDSLLASPDRPMFDRAVGGVYPPGSTFKLVTAVAALQEGAITGKSTIEDTGVIKVGPFSFANWYFTQYGRTEGAVNVVKALERSNDIFFYRVGEKTGIDKLAAWAKTMGAGSLTGIELTGEAVGLMPDPEWKNLRFQTDADLLARNNQWYDGDTYHVAIGQGYLLSTPLQVNLWTNIIASGGYKCRPTLEKVPLSAGDKGSCTGLPIAPETIRLVTEGMVRACDTGGTGWPLFGFSVPKTKGGVAQSVASKSADPRDHIRIPVACKTGTAEFGDPVNRTHAWFTVYAPVPAEGIAGIKSGIPAGQDIISSDAEISITVLLEGAGEGSSIAAPVARDILRYWFTR